MLEVPIDKIPEGVLFCLLVTLVPIGMISLLLWLDSKGIISGKNSLDDHNMRTMTAMEILNTPEEEIKGPVAVSFRVLTQKEYDEAIAKAFPNIPRDGAGNVITDKQWRDPFKKDWERKLRNFNESRK